MPTNTLCVKTNKKKQTNQILQKKDLPLLKSYIETGVRQRVAIMGLNTSNILIKYNVFYLLLQYTESVPRIL